MERNARRCSEKCVRQQLPQHRAAVVSINRVFKSKHKTSQITYSEELAVGVDLTRSVMELLKRWPVTIFAVFTDVQTLRYAGNKVPPVASRWYRTILMYCANDKRAF